MKTRDRAIWKRLTAWLLVLCLAQVTCAAEIEFPYDLTVVEEEAFAGTNLSGIVSIPRYWQTIGDRAFADTDIYALDLSEAAYNLEIVGHRLFGDGEVAYVNSGTNDPDGYCDDALDGARMIIGYGRQWEWYANSRGIRYVEYYDVEECDGFYYEVKDGSATLLCAVDASLIPANVVLPDAVEGSPLESISNSAFFRCPQVRSITLPDGVKTIESGAFDGAPNATVQYGNSFGIVQQPVSVYARQNEWVTLSIRANASNFRWQYYDGSWKDVTYEGQGTDTLRFRYTAALIAEAASWSNKTRGLWRCVVSNAMGDTATSKAVYVAQKPYFVREPEDQAGNPGDVVTFSAQAGGVYKSWQWEYKEDGATAWTKLSTASADADQITVSVTAQNKNRVYRAAAIDAKGAKYISREVRVRTSGSVIITVQPEDQSAMEGDTVTLSLKASYASGYQWQTSADGGATWENIASGTSNAMTLTVEESHFDSLFRCVVTGNSGQAISNVVHVNQQDSRTQLSGEVSFEWTTGSRAILEKGIAVNGKAVLYAYSALADWTFTVEDSLVVEDDGETVTRADGQTSRVLEIVKTSQTTDGNNHIAITLKGKRMGRAVLKGVNGDQEVTCTVEVYGPKPVIVEQPQDQVAEDGDILQFYVDAIGARAYEWNQEEYDAEEDRTGPSISVAMKYYPEDRRFNDNNFQCKVTGEDGTSVYTRYAVVYPPSSCSIEGGDKVVAEGDVYTFNCEAYTCANVYLQRSYDGQTWYDESTFSADRISGYRTFTRELSMTNAYQYYYNVMWRCRGIGFDGKEVYSNVVRVLEPQPVKITKQPEDQYASPGETFHFEIEAENAASYWWQISFDGGNKWSYLSVNGVDQTDQTLSDVARNWKYDGGYMWRCKVTGVSGYELTSNAVTVKRPNFGVMSQPEDQYVSAGGTATFSVQAAGATGYQWQSKSGTGSWKNVSGGTGASLKVTASASVLSSDMEYRCIVKGSDSQTITSRAAKLIERLAITAQPAGMTLAVGGKATFKVTASGAKSYQWQVSEDGGNTWTASTASGAKTATLTFTVTAADFNRLWRCDLVNGDQRLSTQAVQINPLLRITAQPVDAEAQLGSTAVFEIAAENASKYQWQVSANGGASWSNASGTSTSASYSYAVSAQSDYEKRWRCVVSGQSGEQLYSDVVRAIEPTVTPVISVQPRSCYAQSGSTAVFTVAASGVQKYQWQISRNGGSTWTSASGTGAKTQSLSVSVTETLWGAAQWRCLLTGSGQATAVTEAVSVYEPLSITAQPSDVEGRVGYTASFAIQTTGATGYQWQVSEDNGLTWSNCSNIFEAGQALDVPVEAAHFGSYRWRCLVYGPLGDQLTSDMVRIVRANVPLERVTLDMTNITLVPKGTRQLQAFIEPADATDQSITWLSADAKIATVSANGLVTAVATGTTSIRAIVGGLEAACSVTVANDFTVEFPNFVGNTWTEDTHYQGISVKFPGAVLPCTVSASIVDQKGEPYLTASSVTVQQEDWEWATGAFTKAGVFNAVVTATDASGRTVTARTGDITVKRRPVYRALLIYQRDWEKGNERRWFEYDATALKTLLEQNTYEGGAKYEVSISANQTKSGIKSKIKSTFKGVQDGDVSFIWVSCHGVSRKLTGPEKVMEGALWVPAASNEKTMNEHGYYIPDMAGNVIFCDYHIRASEFAGWLNSSIPKGNIFVGLSSCGSGAYVYDISEVKSMGSASDASDSLINAIKDIEASQSRTGELKKPRFNVLTGAAYHEYGWGFSNYGTFLPYWVGDAAGIHRPLFEGPTVFRRTDMLADYDGDGSVTIAECYRYVRGRADESNGENGNPKGYWTDSSFVLFHYDD